MSSTATTVSSDARQPRAEALLYAGVIVATLVALVWALQLWRADLKVPFAYSSDALANGAIVRGMVDSGSWYLANPAVGLPGALDMRDFPQVDGAHYAGMWLIGRFARDWALTVNLYFLLAFPLIAAATLWFMRRIGLSRAMAAMGALLFTFLPYHFFRGQSHLFLGAYFAVPLAAVYCYEAARGTLSIIARREDRWRVERRAAVVAGFVALVVGSGDVYYAFFACALLATGAVVGWVRSRDRAVAASAAALVVAIALVAVANVAPSIAYRAQAGPNTALGGRNPGAAEVYGLKIDQMFLPADGHRLPAFAAVKKLYREGLAQMGPYMENESLGSSLGLVGVAGLLVLVAVAVLGAGGVRFRAGPGPDLPALGTLTLLSVLLGTVGGFGALIAVVLPQIRGYNRISVFIALFALAAVGAVLDRWTVGAGQRRTAVLWGAAVVLGLFGLWDQVTPTAVPPYDELARIYRADQRYLAQVEAALPEGAQVFQLPYMPFPEPGGAIGEMGEYDPFRAYLAGGGALRFSYGAMKGREADAFQREVSQLPPEQMVARLRAEGFSAVWLDLGGVENPQLVVRQFAAAADSRPIQSAESSRFVVISF